MSVDYYADRYDVMKWDDIKTIVPEEAAALEQHLQAAGMDVDEFCRSWIYDGWDIDAGDCEEVVERIKEVWGKLDAAFTAATTVDDSGLALEPEYHDPAYEDAVAFFAVEGVHQLTSAGAKYEDKIERREFIYCA